MLLEAKTGLEPDSIIGDGEVAIEVKGGRRVDKNDLKGIKTYQKEYRPGRAIVVCNESAPRFYENVEILPWRDFLGQLWNGELSSEFPR